MRGLYEDLKEGWGKTTSPFSARELRLNNANDRLWDIHLGPNIKRGLGLGILAGAGMGIGAMYGMQFPGAYGPMHEDWQRATQAPFYLGMSAGAGVITGKWLHQRALAAGKITPFGNGTSLLSRIANKAPEAAYMVKGGLYGTLAGLTIAGFAADGSRGAAIGAGVGLAALAAPHVIGGAMAGMAGTAIKDGPSFLAHGAATLAGGVIKAAQGTEFAARTLLTGSLWGGVQNPLDAWFPYYRSTPVTKITAATKSADLAKIAKDYGARDAAKFANLKPGTYVDPRKFAINPKAIRRVVGIAAAGSILAGFHELTKGMAAPPTAYFDGKGLRHVNDLGADASYGQALMGANFNSNLDTQRVGRIAAQVF